MTERDKEVIRAFEKHIDDFDKNGLAIYDNISVWNKKNQSLRERYLCL